MPGYPFTEAQMMRYARHIVLPEVGGVGQATLLRASVLVVGAGGLGAPLLLYLAAAGVGTLGIIDFDTVDLTNLQRQVIHTTARVGVAKTESAGAAIAALNPEIRTVLHTERLTATNARSLVRAYDLVADGSDNFSTRYLVNDACFLEGRTLVSAAMMRFDGQLTTFKAHLDGDHPCYRCLFREAPPPGLVPSCSEAGIFGAIAGSMGSLQAVEVLKELLGIGESLSGWMVLYDALATQFQRFRLHRDADCPLCGSQRTIKDLSRHAA
ncbi:MAG: molybdopterin-synthase adenylyltransferase MoeB [Alphaproteobacteria bacterium]|nr:molybdopterin-synthase adenylyltransferase MoeB [Alphaproteobacteria bacterium]